VPRRPPPSAPVVPPSVPPPDSPGPGPDVAAQRRHWDEVAPRWWAWREVMEAASRPVSECLADLGGVAPGARVLDVASGFGEPALTAAGRAGPAGLVLATDTSAAMLGLAAGRARAAGLSQMRCLRMDAARPAVRPGAFDAVLCRFGLMALPDLAAGLAGLRAVLRPGGRLAAAVWGPPEAVPSIALPLTVLRRAAGLGPPEPGGPGPFRLADGEGVARALEGAGFAQIARREVAVTYRFASVADFAAFSRATSSPIVALRREAPDLDEEAAWDEVVRAATARAGPDGELVLENRAVCVAGTA